MQSWKDGWIDGWVDGWIQIFACTCMKTRQAWMSCHPRLLTTSFSGSGHSLYKTYRIIYTPNDDKQNYPPSN